MVTLIRKKKSTTKEIQCEFASETFDGTFLARFPDSRRLPEIAKDFDSVDEITVVDTLTEKTYTGYSKLVFLSVSNGVATVKLAKEGENT